MNKGFNPHCSERDKKLVKKNILNYFLFKFSDFSRLFFINT